MKKELEYKHIAPYLEHKLKGRLSQVGIYNLDSEYPNEHCHKIGTMKWNVYENELTGGVLRITEKYSFDICEMDEIEIFLRPWSQLTKEIEVDGKRFVPIVELFKIKNAFWILPEDTYLNEIVYSNEGYAKAWFRARAQHEIIIRESMILELPYYLVEKLFEWHFDVFNLIGSGYAISIEDICN